MIYSKVCNWGIILITIESCLEVCDNPFELVIIASQRARQLSSGARPVVEVERDKSTVVALKEISKGYLEFDRMEEDEF